MRKSLSGFTIVELLIVIVVVGILAAIVTVSYAGISNRATIASLQSDLTNASQQLKLYQILYSAYPTSLDANNCPTSPSIDSVYCLKSSSGNTYKHYQSDNASSPQTFSLQIESANSTSYRITNDSRPSASSDARTSCLDILNTGESTGDGLYWITPSGSSNLQVYCNMTAEGGGWTKVYEGLATSSTSVSRTLGNVVEISNDIRFNAMKIQAKNWNLSKIGTTTETAVLKYPFSWYFEWLQDELDSPGPNVKFHDVDGNQDVQFTVLGQILSGYGNSWRNLVSNEYNLQDADSYMYLGSVPVSIHKADWGYTDYHQHMNDSFPTEGGLGLTPRQYQEIYIWVR